jgi:putative drug exporter of the RND superfamily
VAGGAGRERATFRYQGFWYYPAMTTAPPAATGGLARGYAAVVVALRYLILLGWVVAVGAAALYLRPLAPSDSGSAASLVPASSPALRAEATSTAIFGAPLDAQVAVVQRNARGLSPAVQENAVRRAVDTDTGKPVGGPITGLAGALPVGNADRVFPSSRESSTTVITFLYFRPGTSLAAQTAGGQLYATRNAAGRAAGLVGVTGAVPATYEQGQIISQRLPWVELATVAAIAVIVGFFFLAPGAPLATLLCAATAYLLAVRVVAWITQQLHTTLPPDVEPVLVVLLLGVSTDYSVFFMSGMRNRLAEGLPRLQAARLTTAEYAPIIVAAGLLVAAGTGSLVAARMQLIGSFGPALAATVLTAMVVSMTMAPALIAVFGSALFLPGPGWYRRARREARAAARAGSGWAGSGWAARAGWWRARGSADPSPEAHRPLGVREQLARFATVRVVALLIVAACAVGLLAVGLDARHLRLGSPLIGELPPTATAARAAAAASKGFAPGILSPTEILVLGHGLTADGPALARLQHELAKQPGVAGVIGPASLPAVERQLEPVLARQALALTGAIPRLQNPALQKPALPNPMLAKSGAAARYGVISSTDPLGPTAVGQVEALTVRLPRLARAAGLAGVRIEVGGETAAIGEAVSATKASLGNLALIMLAITFVLLAVFLRALLAPLYLLAASVLALLATLGITVWAFSGRPGYDGLVFYVPFTVAVLLISLGADYNVFVVGRIWEEARRRPLRDAIAVAGSQASRAITVAGIALAASFALLALIPLDQFREVAVAMAAGIVLDAVIVRSLLVPALVALFGRAGMWPGRPPLRGSGRQPPVRQPPARQPPEHESAR